MPRAWRHEPLLGCCRYACWMLQVAPSLGEVVGVPELAAGPIDCIGSPRGAAAQASRQQFQRKELIAYNYN